MREKLGAGIHGNLWEKPLQRAMSLLNGRFGGNSNADEAARRAVIALIKNVLASDRQLSESDYEAVRHLFRDEPPHEITRMLELLRNAPPITAAEAAEALQYLDDNEKRRTIRALLMLSISSDRMRKNRVLLEELANRFGISQDEYLVTVDELEMHEARRRKLLKSGAGIAVALGVLLVFILTATLLRSVIFGLIGAYIMLPVEKYFERKLANRKTVFFRLFHFCSRLLAPLEKFSARFRRGSKGDPSKREQMLRDRRTLINRAVSLTTVTLLMMVLAVLLLLGSLSANYVAKWRANHREAAPPAAAAAVMEPEAAEVEHSKTAGAVLTGNPQAAETIARPALEQFFDPVLRYIDNLRSRFDRMPLVQSTLSELSRALNDEAAQRELVKMFLKRTGGIFSVAAGVVGTICALLLDILLTVFFFLLFLTKLAEFCSDNNSAGRQSEYLVRTVFNGNWLPGAGEETIAEANRIIGEVINKLKVWLRGYLSLVLLDSTVYTTVFYFLGVPYFFILGPLAGCGILLPFIGPIASAVLTLLVTLAVGGAHVSTLQLCGIVITYLIYNGIIEQFILYPVVIGESLGLTTLETIIVVLLGGIFAGIAGMILAIPAAAVLKYLVPQIYHCFDRSEARE